VVAIQPLLQMPPILHDHADHAVNFRLRLSTVFANNTAGQEAAFNL
jgi:hypothetical protein